MAEDCQARGRVGGREGGSIFKATAIFDSYSPGLWFWRHLFPDPSSASTHSPPSLSLSLFSRTCTRVCVKRKRDLYRYHYGRLRSTGNCTMPADTPPISEHRSRSTPSLCSTLLSSNLSKSIHATSVVVHQRSLPSDFPLPFSSSFPPKYTFE